MSDINTALDSVNLQENNAQQQVFQTQLSSKSKPIFDQIIETESIFNKIYDFLPLQDLIKSMQVSSSYYKQCNLHFRQLLLKEHLIDQQNQKQIISGEKQISQQQQSQPQEEVLVTSMAFQQTCLKKAENNNTKIVRFNKLVGQLVDDMQVGTKFSAFHLRNKQMLFMKSEEFLDPVTKPERHSISNIKQFSTNARHLIYLSDKGLVGIVFHQEGSIDINNQNQNYFRIETLEVSSLKPVTQIEVSYNFLVMLHADQAEITVYLLNQLYDISPLNDVHSPQRFKTVLLQPHTIVQSLCIGASFMHAVNQDQVMFSCDLTNFSSQNKLDFLPNKTLANKKISTVHARLNSYFAIEMEQFEGIQFWDNAKLLKWIEQIGFDDYKNIIKYENINGKQLLEADKKFLIDTLGITRVEMQTKLFTEIQKLTRPFAAQQSLWAWGSNQNQQLGIEGGNFIMQPVKVQLPPIGLFDRIKKIETGFTVTCLVTESNRYWLSKGKEQKLQPDVSIESDDQNQKGKAEKNQQKEKQKRKKNNVSGKNVGKQQQNDQKHLLEECASNHKWIEITSQFQCLKDMRAYKLLTISISKDTFCILAAYCGRKEPNHEKSKKKSMQENYQQVQTTTGSKFQQAGNIIDRIQWDTNLNQKEYFIGYEDRFLGNMQVSFEDFLMTDIKEHRIQYFYKNGKVVWDRKNRLDVIFES